MAIQINPNVAQLLTQQGVTGVQERTPGKGVSGLEATFRHWFKVRTRSDWRS